MPAKLPGVFLRVSACLANAQRGIKFFQASWIVLALCPLANLAIARTTILMPLDQEPSWRDMAFLAAMPASQMVNEGGGTLITTPSDQSIGP